MVPRLLLVVIGAAILGVAAIVGWALTSLPDYQGHRIVAGITAPVEIVRDANAVPHIFAATPDDAYFGLGFAHAQDRLWQMEMMRRLGAGRLSEIVGGRALKVDRFMRGLGFARLVEVQFRLMAEPVRRAMDAYVAGVNAWLAGHDGSWPPEFELLGHRPQPWKVTDSLLWGKIMATRLSGNWRDEILRARLAKRLTPQQITEMWPATEVNSTAFSDFYRDFPFADIASVGWPHTAPRGASNSWAFAGERTETGKPILANDPHLGFSAPIVWYLARLEAPGLSVTGATVPGVPVTVLGHNRRIAWGITSTQSDLQDIFVETIDPADPEKYLTPEGPRPFRIRTETIRVKGGEDVTVTIRETRHGPVISDLSTQAAAAAGGGKVLALAATYLSDDDLTAQAIYRINRADGWPAFRAALDDFHAPQQNFVYADVDGNIGFMAAGRVPIRRTGNGWLPQDGATGAGDWMGFIPYPALPRLFNPPDGGIINANHRFIDEKYPFFISHDWAAGYRNRRLHQLLDGENRLDVDKSGATQLDTVSLMARQLLPLMLDAQSSTPLAEEALRLLRAWDGRMARKRPEPLIFTAWLRALNRALYADELGDALAEFRGLRPRFVASILSRRRHWCDDVGTDYQETCLDRLGLALGTALGDLAERFGDDISAWRWGDAHAARFRHAVLTGVPVANLLADLEISMDGGDFTVSRGAIAGAGTRPLAHVHGAGLRAVYDLADLRRSRFIIATGQSGNPLSVHYRDLMRSWRDGRSLRLDRPRTDLDAASLGTLILEPIGSSAR